MGTNDRVKVARTNGLVHVRYYTPPNGKAADLWFDEDNLRWVLENFETFVTTYGHPSIERIERGDDRFTITGGGSDLEPVYFLQNRRARAAAKSGPYSLPLREEPAYEVVEELTTLRRTISA